MRSKNFKGSCRNTNDSKSYTQFDDDFVELVPNTRVSMNSQTRASIGSAMITRSQTHNANLDNMKGKGVVDYVSPSRGKRKTNFVKKPTYCDVDIDDGPQVATKKKKVLPCDVKLVNPVCAPPLKIWEFYTPRNRHATRSVTTHTNIKIVSDIKEKLSDRLYERFKATCFGHFLNMPVFHVQNQLLVALLFQEVVPPSDDALWFIINGKKLKFGLKEFALVTGLKCEGNFLKDYSSKEPNRLVKTYFPGVERVTKTALKNCFNEQKWQNEDDAIKIAVLYFINTFLFSTKNDENHPHLINKEHFDIVESGDWENFPWGIKVFEATIESMHDKVRISSSMYRFAGLPYALLVWFYECCPSVHQKLATRVGDSIPRILNWEVTRHFNFHNLQTGFFTLTGNKMILDNISPSELELCILQLPPDEEPEGDKDFHLEKEDDLSDIDATAYLDEYNDDFVWKEQFAAQLNLIKQAQLDLKKDIQAVNKDIIGSKDLLVATADRIFIELDAIAKKVAANTYSKDCDMEANFSFGFGSDHEVCAEEVTKNNEDHVQMTHTTKESTPIEVDIKVGTNGDDENFTPLSTQDYEIIDETVRSASKGSAKRNSAVNESTPIEVGVKVGTNGDDENFTPLSTQDYETIDETVRSASKGSAKRNSVVNGHGNLVFNDGGHSGVRSHNLFSTQDLQGIFVAVASASTERNSADKVDEHQCKAAYDKTPAHDRRGDIPSFKSFPSQGMIVFSSGSGSSEGNNRGLVDEHPRKPAYDKTPGKESSAIFGAAEYPNFRLFSTQEEQEIFKKDGIGNNVTDLNEHVAGQSKQAEFFKGNDDATLPHNLICAPNYVTPPNHQLVCFRRQPKFNLSSFPNTYGDGCCFPIVSKKVFFSRKHPFTTNIWRRLDSSLANIFRTWIKIQLRKKREEPYNKNSNTLKPKFDFGVCLVEKKDWFHTLHYAERPLEETHLDVIMYYLRKKAKYDHRVNARFTTTDCLFYSIIRDVYNSYKADNNSLTVAADTHILSDYMKGQSMRCNLPWQMVDNVLFPIKVVADWHWVLGRLSFKDRVLYVYDSKLDNYHYDDELIKAMESYSILIPLFLCAIGFYGSRNDLNHKTYLFGEKQMTEPFKVLHCYDMTGVRPNDYGVFAAIFAEHFIHDRPMPLPSCNINRYRKRYGALLWEYGFNKCFHRAESEPED